MTGKIHKFHRGDTYIVLDINSGAVHIVDKTVYRIMDIFDGTNDAEVLEKLSGEYEAGEIGEILAELHELIEAKELFAPDLDVPPTFRQEGLVKSLCLMIAQDCNLRCKYCFGDGGSYGGKRAVMSPEVGRRAVDFLIEKSGPRKHMEIDFFGGEPLMNMKTVKAVTEYVRQREKETGKKCKLTLTTNGMLLHDDHIQWLNDNDFSLVLSLDGRKEVNDVMRPDAGGHGTYDRIVKNFRKCIDSRAGGDYDYRGIYTYLRGTYTKHNLDFTKDVLAMHDEGFNILSMEPVVLKDSPIGIEAEDLPQVFAEYDRLVDAYMERRRAGKGFFFFHFNMDLSNGPCVAKRLAGCGAGHEYFAVAEDGTLYPCHQFVGREQYRLGNIYDGVTNTELPPHFRAAHVMNKPTCRTCWARFFCSGGCHANADLFHGDIYQPYEIGCEIQRKRLESAILVQSLIAMEE
ncbi:thioether cross-link-forming SCIFF peptide maturase [Selenomonas sp. TAMA-11512]|uniref:thioether cross-link-forming SCIFF peptide maturase n=1 Tax=Selenomonas sp. TAMA-11512 TaxID=3095337 RepID=UPI003088C10C|nr:thioether cross-link-forming SCIFF peptide maturase [Selenomonas sp. TAMA-11512]